MVFECEELRICCEPKDMRVIKKQYQYRYWSHVHLNWYKGEQEPVNFRYLANFNSGIKRS